MIDSSPKPATEPSPRSSDPATTERLDPALVDPALVDPGFVDPELVDVPLVETLLREREALRAHVARLESRYHSLFEGTQDAVLIHDPRGRVVDANGRALRLFGYDLARLRDLRLADLTHSASRIAIRRAFDALQAGAQSDEPPFLELEMVKATGEVFAAELSLQPAGPDGNGSTNGRRVQSFLRDLTEQRHAERRLHDASFRDEVTGLPNRAHLLDRVQIAIDRSLHRADARFALLLIGLDRIDLLSDGLGHVAGATLLRQFADRLRATTTDDAPARVGDGLFALLLQEIHGVIDARQTAENIAEELLRPFRIGRRELYLGATVGIVTSDGDYERAEDCLRDADIALADARRDRSGTHRVFDPGMHDRLVDQLDLEHGLRRALEGDELVVHYQPVVHLESGTIRELEALVRWRHPRKGLLAPGLFLPLAAELGLDAAIDDHVIRVACGHLAAWRRALGDRAPRRVAVNVASRRFGELELVPRLRHALDESRLAPEHLRVEVTEGALIQETEAAVAVLGQLRALGVRASLDDFGTGYSSLDYLHRFPVDTLKIDRSFVSGPSEDSPVLEAAVALGHQLGLEVVAEGVETQDDLERVRRLGCEHAQGWHFARALDQDSIVRLLRDAPRW